MPDAVPTAEILAFHAPLEVYRAIFGQAREAMLLIDPLQDRVHGANDAACRLLRRRRDLLVGTPATRLFPDELPALVVFTDSVLENGAGWTNELACRTGDGRDLSVEISASAVRLGERAWLLLMLRDLAAERRRQEEAAAHRFVRRGIAEWRNMERVFQDIEHENQLILRAAGEGIYGLNNEGKTTFVNPAAERLLGWSAEEMVGKSMHHLVHHSHPDGSVYPRRSCPIYAAFQDGQVHHVEDEVFWRKDGTSIPVEYTSTPIRDHGRLVGAVVVFRDISDRKQAEAELRRALDEVGALKQRLEMENAYLLEEIEAEHDHQEIVGNSAAMRRVMSQVALVAPTDASVLVTGESGTGKELIARAIHRASPRSSRPLVRVNCAAVPRDLFESEFFGHARGAFTGAVRDRTGRFELADGGTLFLDEVGEIPLELQGKLLRVLQEGQFERVGEARTRTVDVRVIAATNRDLQADVGAGRFREDLYFRLNVFPVESVPLRARRDDIPLLAAHFLARASRKLKTPPLALSRADAERLMAYPWPGNVRELENVIERAVILSRDGRLRLELPQNEADCTGMDRRQGAEAPPQAGPSRAPETEAERRRRERENVIAALRATGGRVFGKGGAAEVLGLKPTTLASRLKRMGIDARSYRAP
jgi:PAS domain S-box-containing protein